MSNTITIYNSLNTNRLRTIIDSVFTISWGDGTPDTELPMHTVYDEYLPFATHYYVVDGTYDIEITINSPWKVEKLKRRIIIPLLTPEFPTDFGTLTFTVPYSNPAVEQTQTYLEDYRELTGSTDNTDVSFLATGRSRLEEFKTYGSSNQYTSDIDITTEYTGYTIDGLYYMDYSEGYTYISGWTGNYTHEEFYYGMLTRDEHLIGFLDTPQIYSDVFIERGKQSVMERNLRLGEIDSTGELEIYGSGFFKVKKQ